MSRTERTAEVEYCPDCGWEHANLPGCWRKALREARETLARPGLALGIRAELQTATDALEQSVREDVAFYEALAQTAQTAGGEPAP